MFKNTLNLGTLNFSIDLVNIKLRAFTRSFPCDLHVSFKTLSLYTLPSWT